MIQSLLTGSLGACNRLMSVIRNGRLGNLMSQYATLILVAERLGFTPVVSHMMKEELSRYFNITVKTADETRY